MRRLKPNLGKAVAHLILSPGPEDRALSKEEWKTALDIALDEHGAANAAHAAWLHDDTDHQHLHVFFSRVTPAGDVISDSHSFQKNRSASKKITQELKLTPLPTTPSPTASADRHAHENAQRSAERRNDGIVDPTLMRSALDQSKTRNEFSKNLRHVGIESKFATRGVNSEIFGVSVRLIGTDAWLKASTLGKDLSWPRISTRFPESDRFASADKELEGQTPAAGVEPPPALVARGDLERMPSAARNILSMAPAESETDSETALVSVSRRLGEMAEEQARGGSPLVMTGLFVSKLAVMCMELSKAAAKALLAFVIRLLRVFGIGIRQVEVTPAAPLQIAQSPAMVSSTEAGPPSIELQAYRLPVNSSVPNADSDAAAVIEHVIGCVQSGRTDDLPEVGDGQEAERSALIRALEIEDAAATGVAGAAAASASMGPAPEPQETDVFERLYGAAEEYSAAKMAVEGAPKVESVEVRNARLKVAIAQQSLLRAQTKFQREHPTLFSLGRMKKHTVEETEAVAQAQRQFESSKIDFPPTAEISLVQEKNSKGMAFLNLSRLAVRELRDQLPLVSDSKIAEFAAASVARLEKSVTEFKGTADPRIVTNAALRAQTEVKKFIENDRSLARKKYVESRLEAAAPLISELASPDGVHADGEQAPRG